MFVQEENKAGYIYYVNKNTGEHQNDNQKLVELLNVIRDENYCEIKYAAYRCASKLWILKQSLYTVNIPYHFVTSVLSHFGLNQCDNAPALKPTHLTALLHDIYFAAEKCGHFSQRDDFELNRGSSMLANLFWLIFDSHRSVPISLLEFKQLMLIMCNVQNFDKFIMEEFVIAADHNRCINRFRFESMAKVLAKIFTFIGEGTNYGWSMILNCVPECFEQCPGMIGLNEFQFTCLWSDQTINFAQVANVLALVLRIRDTQDVLHDVQCVNCKIVPIQGFRFKCQQCRKLSLCFDCFTKGFTNSKHRISHRMYEISVVQMENKTFGLNLMNCLKCKRSKKSSTNDSAVIQNDFTIETKVSDEKNITVATINCINESKFASIRNVRQLKDFDAFARKNGQTTTERMQFIIDLIKHRTNELNRETKMKKSPEEIRNDYCAFLKSIEKHLQDILREKDVLSVPHSSTPYRAERQTIIEKSHLQSSIKGYDINKSFVENNRSDLSVGDVSTWFHQRSQVDISSLIEPNHTSFGQKPSDPIDRSIDTDMNNFKTLLEKIREIMEDANSDNSELSRAANNLEHVVERIVSKEEQKRTYL